jgi:hypothetical protein
MVARVLTLLIHLKSRVLNEDVATSVAGAYIHLSTTFNGLM